MDVINHNINDINEDILQINCNKSEENEIEVNESDDNKSDESFESEIIDNETDERIDSHLTSILNCLTKSDVKGLQSLATINGGFLSDRLRQKIWPKLLKLNVIETSPRPDSQTIESHPFYNQVLLDVNRSLKRFPPSIGSTQRISMTDSLVRLIMRVLIKNPELYYFQGYHDICVTFLLIMGEEMAFYIVNKLSKTHFKVFMEETMESTADLLDIIPIILKLENVELSQHIEKSSVGTIYPLSWVITWFSHVLKKYEDVARLFDFFLVSHRLMPFYLTVAIILYKQKEILTIDCEMSSMHHFLTNIVECDDLPFDSLIGKALTLIDKYPPNEMIKMQEIQKKKRLEMEKRKYSLLKRVFNFRYLFNSITRFNFISITVLIVFCATLYQYYWNV
jgi:hypothetical protein